jgi:hypothetical protein
MGESITSITSVTSVSLFFHRITVLPIDGTNRQLTNFRLHGGQLEIRLKYFHGFLLSLAIENLVVQ